MNKEITYSRPPCRNWSGMTTAAEVILDEIEVLSKAFFEKGYISQEWLDDIRDWLVERRDEVKVERNECYVTYGEFESVFASACRTYSNLYDEVNGKNKAARVGWDCLIGSHNSHPEHHAASAVKQARQEKVRSDFLEMRGKVCSNGKPPSKEVCYKRLSMKYTCSIPTIKRDCRGL